MFSFGVKLKLCFFCVILLLEAKCKAVKSVYDFFENSAEGIPNSQNLELYKLGNTTYDHAESPVWDEDTNTLYWVDVHRQNVHAMDFSTGNHRTKHIGYGQVNVVTAVRNTNRLLVAVRAEVYLMDWYKLGDSSLRLVAAVDIGLPDNVINEGKADQRGRYWFGTKGPQYKNDVARDKAALYSLKQSSLQPQIELKPVTISNGLVWGLNNSIFYYTDSQTQRIDAFDYDLDKGFISNRRTIVDITEYGYDEALPDGMTIDRDGNLWVALIFAGTVIRIDPVARQIVEKYVLPAKQTTSVTWAGSNLEDLVVTTSRHNMNYRQITREPLSGSVLVLRGLGTGGVPAYKVAFEDADKY